MSPQPKKIVINHNSFVGVSPRSKSGCLSCRKRKKKCDEVHPVCGHCEKKGLTCIWREPTKKNTKYQFDVKSIIESQNMIKLQKSNTMKPRKATNMKNEKVKPAQNNKIDNIEDKKENTQKNNKEQNIGPNKEITNCEGNSKLFEKLYENLNERLEEKISNMLESITNTPPNTIPESTCIPSPLLLTQPEPLNTPIETADSIISDADRAVNELMNDQAAFGSFIDNVIGYVKTPEFNPDSNVLDFNINSAIKQAQNYITSISSPMSMSPIIPSIETESIKLIGARKSPLPENKLSIIPKETEDDVTEYDSNDTYHPMDESQLLENVYISETDLLKVFKSKRLHPYLKPTVHLLLSKNNSLKLINPSSPIMNQLDSTARLFLENYVTNVAMYHLDIGTNQFFLDYAISMANNNTAVLYCLVAWGGMFLVGRDNEVANTYIEKSLAIIEEKKNRMMKSKSFDNNEHIEILLFYVLLFGADVSTGDADRWYKSLLHCRNILKNYGGLRQFVLKNKDNKVAKWILSNIFYHDVFSSRITDLGMVISINEYSDAFKNQKFLQNDDYGLDPFYGLSQDLYLLLGEVADYRRKMNAGKNYKNVEDSWFQIFDSRIINCKPPANMLDIIIKQDPSGKLMEHHLTFFELTQITLRIYIRITFKELSFDDDEIQLLRERGLKLYNILIGTKLQTLLGLSLLMLGVTSISETHRTNLRKSFDRFISSYHVLNVRLCWEIIKQVWGQYDIKTKNEEYGYVDWTKVVGVMGWNCCLT